MNRTSSSPVDDVGQRFQKRAASVNPMADPERDDPRAELTQEQLAAVNRQSMRLAKKLDGWSRAAISWRLGQAVVGRKDLMSADDVAIIRTHDTHHRSRDLALTDRRKRASPLWSVPSVPQRVHISPQVTRVSE